MCQLCAARKYILYYCDVSKARPYCTRPSYLNTTSYAHSPLITAHLLYSMHIYQRLAGKKFQIGLIYCLFTNVLVVKLQHLYCLHIRSGLFLRWYRSAYKGLNVYSWCTIHSLAWHYYSSKHLPVWKYLALAGFNFFFSRGNCYKIHIS